MKVFLFTIITVIIFAVAFHYSLGQELNGYQSIFAFCILQFALLPRFRSVDTKNGSKIQLKWIWSKKTITL